MSDLRRSISDLRNLSDGLDACIESLERLAEPVTPGVIWDRDLRNELPRNDLCLGILADGWWRRRLEQINGLTVHHTLSHSPHATTRHYLGKGGSRPSIPYHLWVTQTGEVLYCLDLTEGCWHDHTGHKNRNVSLGLAGSLHINRPPEVQLNAAARVIGWAIRHDEMDIVLSGVRGHCDHFSTVCPGWASDLSGNWKSALFNRIYEQT